jgi:hypothetical protein
MIPQVLVPVPGMRMDAWLLRTSSYVFSQHPSLRCITQVHLDPRDTRKQVLCEDWRRDKKNQDNRED